MSEKGPMPTEKERKKASFYDTTYADVDIGLQMYFNERYSFQSRNMGEKTYYAVLMAKDKDWRVKLLIDESDVQIFSDDELITFLIEKIVDQREKQGATKAILAVVLILGAPAMFTGILYFDLVNNEMGKFILTIIITLFMLPFVCFLIGRAQKRVDTTLLDTRENFIKVLEKLAENADNAYDKMAYETRIEKVRGLEN